MNKKIAITIPLLLITLVLAGCISNSSNNMDGNQSTYAEDFEFKLLDGTKKNTSEYSDKNLLIDFFGVYCPPCQQQMLVLAQINDKYRNSDLEIISIDVWIASGETASLVEQFVSSYGQQGIYLNWTFGVDDEQGTLLKKYASKGVPTIYLLDKNGNIYYSKVGYTDYKTLNEKLNELIDTGR
jgi:thiol-disulfide isomerase/thioredoxin